MAGSFRPGGRDRGMTVPVFALQVTSADPNSSPDAASRAPTIASVRSADTSPEAYELQIAAYRHRGPARRVELAVQMSEEVWELAADGIRARHPGYGPDD